MENQNTQNQNTQQQKLQTQYEELEKRVATLSKKVKEGANTQELQNQIAQAQADIETMQTNLINATNIATGVQSQVQTNTSNISQNTSKITTNTNKITNLTTRMSNAESNILALTGGIDVSEELNEINQILDEHCDDVYLSAGDFIKYNLNIYGSKNTDCNGPLIGFYCSKYQSISFNLKFLFTDITQQTTSTLKICINDKLIKTTTYSLNSTTTISDTVISSINDTHYNYIKFIINSSEFCVLKSVELNAIGRNFMFLYDDNNFCITCFNDNYYISSTDGNITYYDIKTKDNLSLALNNSIIISNTEPAFYYHYFPNLKIDENNIIQFCENINYVMGYTPYRTVKYSLSSRQLTFANGRDILAVNSTGECDGIGFGASLYYVFSDHRIGFTCWDDQKMTLIYTDSKIEKNYIDILPIINRYSKIGDTAKSFNWIIAMRTDGYYYICYIENKNTIKKSIKLFKGRFATAYLQTDGKINVYYNKSYQIFKMILEYDIANNEYNIFSNVKYTEGYKLYEGLDGVYFIKTNNGVVIKNT